MKIVPVTVRKNKSAVPTELDKRTYAPYTLTAVCPKCSATVKENLMEHYLSYPCTDVPSKHVMYCGDTCQQEFEVRIMVRLVVETV